MTKDVLVSISGAHRVDGENDQIAVIAPGSYYYKNGKHYVIYEEIVEGFQTPIKNVIKVSKDGMEITKNARAHLNFQKNRKNISCYDTPVGAVEIGIHTSDISIQEDDHQLKVQVGYSLDINGQMVSQCCVLLDVQSKEQAQFRL